MSLLLNSRSLLPGLPSGRCNGTSGGQHNEAFYISSDNHRTITGNYTVNNAITSIFISQLIPAIKVEWLSLCGLHTIN